MSSRRDPDLFCCSPFAHVALENVQHQEEGARVSYVNVDPLLDPSAVQLLFSSFRDTVARDIPYGSVQ